MGDRVADTTALLAEWEAASEYAKSWDVFDGDRMTDAGDALASALTAAVDERDAARDGNGRSQERCDELFALLSASLEREQQLREALQRIADMPIVWAGTGISKGARLDTAYDVARDIASAALAASSEGQTA